MTSDSASRVTRSRASLRRALLLTAAGFALAGALRAQEAARTAEAAAPARTEGTQATTDAEQATPAEPRRPVGGPVPGGDAAAKDTPRPAGGGDRAAKEPAKSATEGTPDHKPGVVGTTPGRFEPTEKVRADFDVSFPVDI